ncbi:MAG TPA: alpha/beta hydrolase [Caulobacteraceae bacterium]|jgi:pimeloyl-ACP methyl ester carboxylesterase|nr:alpha/beta hydrolase [Caulobacteraceae bacterium]
MSPVASMLTLDGAQIEYRWFGPPASPARSPVVMLHEGLGSVSTWRDFPDALAERLGAPVLAYSRRGHGWSDFCSEPREPSYMHHEGEVVLPQLLEALGVKRPLLFGHSDGASIALIYASAYPDAVRGLILEAPHVFVENLTVKSIADIGAAYASGDLGRRLARHHQDPDHTFWCWNHIWLDRRFRDWNLEARLDRIVSPILLIQGEDDEYGTKAQLEAIVARTPRTDVLLLEACGHAPHRDRREAVLDSSAQFVAELDAAVARVGRPKTCL